VKDEQMTTTFFLNDIDSAKSKILLCAGEGKGTVGATDLMSVHP